MIDYGVYFNDYLQGREAKIDPKEWGYYSMQAQQSIRLYVTALPLNDDNVKMCICEVAEIIAVQDKATVSDNVAAESVGDVHITYADKSVASTAYKAKIRSVVYRWLANTGLLYRGIR